MRKILLCFGIIGTLFLALIIFSISLMGDRYCSIQIQNGSQEPLILKTFQYTNYDKKLTVDSINLKYNEKLEIGHCISCSTPDTLNIDFDAIGHYDPKGNFKIMNKSELIDYLETKVREDCITYLIN